MTLEDRELRTRAWEQKQRLGLTDLCLLSHSPSPYSSYFCNSAWTQPKYYWIPHFSAWRNIYHLLEFWLSEQKLCLPLESLQIAWAYWQRWAPDWAMKDLCSLLSPSLNMGKWGAVPGSVCMYSVPFFYADVKILMTGHDSRVGIRAPSWVCSGMVFWCAGCPCEGVFIHLGMFLRS